MIIFLNFLPIYDNFLHNIRWILMFFFMFLVDSPHFKQLLIYFLHFYQFFTQFSMNVTNFFFIFSANLHLLIHIFCNFWSIFCVIYALLSIFYGTLMIFNKFFHTFGQFSPVFYYIFVNFDQLSVFFSHFSQLFTYF